MISLNARRAIACACAACAAVVPAAAAEARPASQHFASGTDVYVPVDKLPSGSLQSKYLRLYERAEKAGADVGRNIVLRGEKTRDGRVRAATETEIRRSVRVLERMVATREKAPAADGGEQQSAPATGATGAAGGSLQSIAACESGGDASAVGGGGQFRGKYQFTQETWQSVGGSGDPASAPEAEQDRRAAMLLARDGAGHWPNCG